MRTENMMTLWKKPQSGLTLAEKEIHIWLAALDLPSRRVEGLQEKLSIDERMKADCFRFDQDRNRCIASFGILKDILSLYIGIDPASVQISYGSHGKPRLSDASGKDKLHFNLSHSEGSAVYVFARDYEVGVDIERIRDLPEMNKIVEHFFSAREKIAFGELPSCVRREAFFRCWTRKEAVVKAIGEGLYQPFDKFDVAMTPSEQSVKLSVKGDPKMPSHWLIQDLKPAPGFAGAFAVEDRSWKVCCWRWKG